MSNVAFVLGNGESRRGIRIADLKQHGTVFACNAVYRTEEPDYLIAVDPKMIMEIAETDYPKTHEVWTNYNHQYSKNENAKNHIKWFQPSLGWSSGPTALKMAADKKAKPGKELLAKMKEAYNPNSVDAEHRRGLEKSQEDSLKKKAADGDESAKKRLQALKDKKERMRNDYNDRMER